MSEQVTRHTPLNGNEATGAPEIQVRDLTITEQMFNGYFNLRIPPEETNIHQGIGDEFQLQLPDTANTFTSSGQATCAWLGPDEWLLIVEEPDTGRIERTLNDLFRGQFATWTEQSSGLTALRFIGSNTIALLNRGIVFDLHPRNFKPGDCVQTVLARVGVTVLNRSNEQTEFDVLVRRSFADYLWQWLVAASNEATFSKDLGN